jgi:hypothetical protein
MTRRLRLTSVALLGILSGGCEATHLAYVNEMNLGVDVSYSTEGTGHLVLGFDRNTFALVPQRKVDGEDDELMSLSAASRMSASGLDTVEFDHFIATGTSASQIGTNPTTLRAIRDGIVGIGETK